jgi:DNA-binding winged helix-turn-helix (wHTH) protein
MTRATPGVLIRKGADGAQERIALSQDVTTLGRSDSCAVVIVAPTISRLHARIELQHDRYFITDAGSANGTFVNLFSDPEETLAMLPSLQPEALLIDDNARIVRVYDVAAPLSPLEYDLLLYLAHHVGAVCTRESCYLAVWKQTYDQATCEDALNACIGKLRRNLRQAAEATHREPPVITTIQRVGFRLDTPVTFVGQPKTSFLPPLQSRETNQ